MTPISPEEVRAMVAPGRVQPAPLHRPGHFRPRAREDFRRQHGFMSAMKARSRMPVTSFATRIGKKPLLLVRDAGGRLQLLHNQCAHRGSLVVARRRGPHIGVSLLLSRLDLSPRWPAQGGSAAARLSRAFRRQEPRMPPCCRVPRVASYRGFVFGSLTADGPSLDRLPRLHDHVVRRHGRPRARRRARGRRRRIQARLQRQLEALPGEPVRRRASAVHASSSIDAAAQQSRRRRTRTARARSPSGRCARTARPTASGKRMSASGPIPTATASSATITTTPSSSPR